MFVVYVADNFHYMEEVPKRGEYATWAEAVAAAKAIVDRSVRELIEPGASAGEVYQRYTMFGEDPFIVPPVEGERFSAWAYARRRCEELTQEGDGRADDGRGGTMLQRDVDRFVEALDAEGVRYAVEGGSVSESGGRAQYPKELTILVEMGADNGERMVRALERFGLGYMGLTVADFVGEEQMLVVQYPLNRLVVKTTRVLTDGGQGERGGGQ